MMKKIFSGAFFSILSVVLVVVLFLSIVTNIVLVTMVAIPSDLEENKSKSFKVEHVDGKKNSSGKILIVPINGVIADESDDYTVTSNYIKKVFKQAEEDKEIKGVILKINSPGGTITATDKMYHTIMQYKEKTNIPVIAYFDSVAASGGYYVAMTCDKIIAHSTTITGSIGVIMSFYEIKELLENKLGIKSIVIKSGKHKDIGSSARSMSDEETEILNTIIQEMYMEFTKRVRSGRKELREMPQEELMKIADGRIYTGKQALEHKLIDSIGYFEKAQDEICSLANVTKNEMAFITYKANKNIFYQLLESTSTIQSNVHKTIQNNLSPKFYYMWRP